MPDTPAILTDVTIHVVDVAAEYANLDPAAYAAMFGRPYAGPDWRTEVTFPDGTEMTMHAAATAADVATAVVALLPGHSDA